MHLVPRLSGKIWKRGLIRLIGLELLIYIRKLLRYHKDFSLFLSILLNWKVCGMNLNLWFHPFFVTVKDQDSLWSIRKDKSYTNFLLDLNNTHSQVRSKIFLLVSPLPTICMAYSMIMSDESQKPMAQLSMP